MPMMIVDIVGWSGSVLGVAAYALNIYGKLSSSSIMYYALNIAGSSGLMIHTIYHHALPSMVVNIVWIFIAMVALSKKMTKGVQG